MKLLKTLFVLLTAFCLLLMTGCPNGEEKEEEKSNAVGQPTAANPQSVSGIASDITIVGDIEGTKCDITLNAADGTWTATQSSRSDVVSYSGEFFYYNGQLMLMVKVKNNESLNNSIFLSADVASTELHNESVVTLTDSDNGKYLMALTEFKETVAAASAEITVDGNALTDTKWVCEALLTCIVTDPDTKETSKSYDHGGDVIRFLPNNKVFLFRNILDYTVSGSTVSAAYQDSEIVITFHENNMAELLVNTKYNGEVLRSVNGTYRKLGTDDFLSLESYKLDESQTASDTLIGIIVFGLNNSFTTWDNPDGGEGSNGIYALSGNNITLAFTSGKIKSGSITGTISSDLSSMTLSGSVITKDSETVSVSGTYNKEVWTAKTTSNSIFKYKPVVHHPISDFVGTWNVTGGSYLDYNSDYTDWKIVFDAEGYMIESYTVSGTPRSYTYEIEDNTKNILHTLYKKNADEYYYDDYIYEINGDTMTLDLDPFGNLLTNLMVDSEPFYILTKQTN